MAAIFLIVMSLATLQVTLAQESIASSCTERDCNNTSSVNSDDFWEGVPGQENIVKLNEDNYDDFIKDRTWVHYYNTWCPVFKDARESIAKIATALVEKNYPGGVGAFECHGTRNNEKPICEEYRKKCWHYNVYYYGGNYIESYPYATVDYEAHAIRFMEAHIDKPDEKVYPNSKC